MTAGGVVGTIAGRAVMIGKPDFLRIEKITGLEALEASAMKLQEEGKTAMFVAIDGEPTGFLAVADPIKSTTPEAIRELHALGLELVMLTGGNRGTAAAVARQLGLDAVEAEIEPAGKVAHIKKLRAEGKHVAMAGDGINDAPALSEAEVGIAVGTGTGRIEAAFELSLRALHQHGVGPSGPGEREKALELGGHQESCGRMS